MDVGVRVGEVAGPTGGLCVIRVVFFISNVHVSQTTKFCNASSFLYKGEQYSITPTQYCTEKFLKFFNWLGQLSFFKIGVSSFKIRIKNNVKIQRSKSS